jgi:hypothetical protein
MSKPIIGKRLNSWDTLFDSILTKFQELKSFSKIPDAWVAATKNPKSRSAGRM